MFYVCSCVDVTLRSVTLFSRLDTPTSVLGTCLIWLHKGCEPVFHNDTRLLHQIYIHRSSKDCVFSARWKLRSQPHMFVSSNRSMNIPSCLTAYPLPSNLLT